MVSATTKKEKVPEAVESHTKARHSDFLNKGFQAAARQYLKDLDKWTFIKRENYEKIEGKINSLSVGNTEEDSIAVWRELNSIWIKKTRTLSFIEKASMEKEASKVTTMEEAAECWKAEMGHMVERRTPVDPGVEGADLYNNYYKAEIAERHSLEDYGGPEREHAFWLGWDVMMRSWRGSADTSSGNMPPPPFMDGMDKKLDTPRNVPPPPPMDEPHDAPTPHDQTHEGAGGDGSGGGGEGTRVLQDALKSTKQQLAEEKGKREAAERKLAQEQLKTAEAQQQVEQANKRVRSVEKHLNSVNAADAGDQRKLQGMRELLDEYHDDIASKDRRITELSNQNAQLTEQLEGKEQGKPRPGAGQEALDAANKDRERLAAQLEQAQEALNTQESRHKAQIDEWSENVGHARLAQTTAHQKEVDRLKTAGKELEEKLGAARRALKDNQTKTEQAHGAKVKELSQKIVSANKATAEERGKREAAEGRAAELQKTVDGQQRALDIAEKVLDSRQLKNEELSTAISNATREAGQRDEKINELGSELAERERSNAQLSGQITGLQDGLRGANRTVEHLRSRELDVATQEAANKAEKGRLEKWSSAVDNQKDAQEQTSKEQAKTKQDQAKTAKAQAGTGRMLEEERVALERLRADLERRFRELSDGQGELDRGKNLLAEANAELQAKIAANETEASRLRKEREDWERRMALMEGITDMDLAKWHTAEQVMLHGSPTAKSELINQRGSEDYLTARRKEDGETIAHFIADVGSEDNLMALIGRGKKILGLERYIDGKTVADTIRERGSEDVQKALDRTLEEGTR